MSSNYPEGSMRGSGIYSQEVQYDKFLCDGCDKENPEGDTATDDWGNYSIECEFCGHTQTESSISEDEYDAKADSDYDAWRDEQDERD
jgi:hypothetical protein